MSFWLTSKHFYTVSSLLPPLQVSVPAGKVSPKEEERKDESPASWRLGLRKTGSYGALAEISAAKEAQKEKDLSGVMRSASSPRLTSSLDNKDKEKVSPTEPILSETNTGATPIFIDTNEQAMHIFTQTGT